MATIRGVGVTGLPQTDVPVTRRTHSNPIDNRNGCDTGGRGLLGYRSRRKCYLLSCPTVTNPVDNRNGYDTEVGSKEVGQVRWRAKSQQCNGGVRPRCESHPWYCRRTGVFSRCMHDEGIGASFLSDGQDCNNNKKAPRRPRHPPCSIFRLFFLAHFWKCCVCISRPFALGDVEGLHGTG